MPHYSVQPRDRIIVKGYGFLSFAKNMSKNVSENISKKASAKDTQKSLDHARKSAADARFWFCMLKKGNLENSRIYW